MGDVIHVDFSKTNSAVTRISNDAALTEYLKKLSESGIDDDDILDTVDAINDKDVYFAADEVVQALSDSWLHQFL